MKRFLICSVLRFPKTIYSVVAIVVILLLSQLPSMQIDTDPENMLSTSDPYRSYHNEVKQQFSLYDSMVLGVVNTHGIYNPQSLGLIHQITDFVLTLDGVIAQDVIAPSVVDNIQNEEDGVIRFNWLMKQAPINQQQADDIANAVSRLPLLNNTMVSSNHQAIAVYIPIANKTLSYQIAEKIRNYVKQFDGDHQFYVTGLPVAEDQFGSEMFVQMAISAPLAGAMIFFMMWLFFRNFSLICAPMFVALATVIITMGLLVTFGFKVHILSSMIAIFLMPIAVVDSIHIMSEFADRYRTSEKSAAEVIKQVVTHLFQPMLFTSVTSAVGFFSLMLTPIPPVKVFGAFVGFGILLAFFLTILILPAYLSRLSPKALQHVSQLNFDKKSILDSGLESIKQFSQRQPLLIVGLVLVIAGLSYIGISKIQINDNPVRWFKQDHEIRVADHVLNEHFAGTYSAYLVLSNVDDNETDFANHIARIKSSATTLNLVFPEIKEDLNLSNTIGQWLTMLDDYQFEFDGQLSEQQAQFIERQIEQLTAFGNARKKFYKPGVLQYISKLQQALLTSPEVGKVNSLTDLIKTVNRELVSGDDKDFVLPATSDGVSQVLMQFQSSHRPDDLWHFVTPDQQASLLWLQLKSGDNQSMQKVLSLVDDYVVKNPLPIGIELKWAGKAYINVIWQQQMVSGMLDSLIGAFIIVLIMMVILFRSLPYGLLAMLPLTITIALIYGLIGWIGKDYDMPIAVLSSLTLGLSVDFAIHFIERFRELLKQSDSFEQVIDQMFSEPARAISRNAIVIACGFTPLLLAPLVPYITVGVFLASIMAISAVVTLILLPAVLKLVMVKRKDNQQQTECQPLKIRY